LKFIIAKMNLIHQQIWQPIRAPIVPVFVEPDLIHLTYYSGDKIKWPAYMSLGNNNLTIRAKPPNLGSILVALLPVLP